jgi:hypothetical protein
VNLYEHTGLGRHLDVRLLSNRVAVAVTALVGIIAFAARWLFTADFDLLADGYAAGATAVGVFLAWAIARELDPDRPRVATIAMVLAAGLTLLGTPAPAVAGIALLAFRILVGSVGTRLRPADIAVLLGAAAYAGTRPEAWPAAAALVVATAMTRPTKNAALPIGLGATAILGALVSSAAPAFASLSATSFALLGATAAAIALAWRVPAVASTDDRGSKRISTGSVVAARLLATAVVVGTMTFSGGAAAVTPIVASLAAVALPLRRATTPSPEVELAA